MCRGIMEIWKSGNLELITVRLTLEMHAVKVLLPIRGILYI